MVEGFTERLIHTVSLIEWRHHLLSRHGLGTDLVPRVSSQGEAFIQTLTILPDYPWSELNSATIVDVGGGVGKSLIKY